MVTKYERELQRAAVAKGMRVHVDAVHAVASRVPFWRLDDTGDETRIRDLDGPPLATFPGIHAAQMADWIELIGRRTAAMALANLIRASTSTAEHAPSREAALRLLQEVTLEAKPSRYRRH